LIHARPDHRHHPTVDLDPVPVRVEEVEGVAPATADETLLASLGGVDDIHAARAHMVERQEPVLARVDLENDVIEARGSADAGVGRCDACLPRVLGRNSNLWCRRRSATTATQQDKIEPA
jgi:hypothetical protein